MNTHMYNRTSSGKKAATPLPLLLRGIGASIFLLLLSFGNAQAQAPTISYPTAAADLTRGYSQSLLTVKLVFNGVCTGTVRLGLPASVTYVAGTVTKTSGTASVTIGESSIADLSKPEFSISGVATIGDEITFTVARRAGCGSLATAKDSIYFIAGGGGCADGSEVAGTVNTYNINIPSISITPPTALTGVVVGTTASRTTIITNGGNGPVDTVRFYVVYPAAGIVNSTGTNAITANGLSFSPSSTSGDTLFYKIFGATLFGGNNVLTSGETVTIVEPIRVAKCNTTTTYAARWGRNDAAICQTAAATSGMTMAVGVPNYTAANFTKIGYTNACGTQILRLTITNTGTGNATAAAMYNVQFVNYNNDMSTTSRYTLSNYKIGTTFVTPTFTGPINLQLMTVNLAALALTTDPDGAGVGIEDVDGDGFYDDLPQGNTMTFEMNFTIKDFRTAYCDPLGSSYYWRWVYNVGFSTMCSNTVSYPYALVKDLLIALSIDGPALKLDNFSPTTVSGGVPFRIESVVTNSNAGLGNLFMLWPTAATNRRWIHRWSLPAGVALSGTGNPTVNGIPTTASVSGSTVSINVDGQINPGQVALDFIYTCGSTGKVTIPYTLEFIDDRIAPCVIDNELLCYSFDVNVIGCGGCSVFGGIGPKVNIPEVRRDANSYGYTNGTLTTRQLYTAIPVYQQKQLIPYDTLFVSGSVIQNASSSNFFHRFKINKTTPSKQNKLTPLNAEVTVFRGGASVSSCTVGSSVVSTALSTTDTSAFEWDFSSCLPIGGLLVNDSIVCTTRYWVSTKELPANSFVLDTTTRYTYYNKDLLGIPQICDEFPITIYLLSLDVSSGIEILSLPLNGCNEVLLSRNINYTRIMGGEWPFSNELRPLTTYDTVSIRVPQSVTITRLTSLSGASTIPGTGGITYLPTSTITHGDGTKTVIFANDGTFPINSGSSYISLDIYGIPSNATPSPANYVANRVLRDAYYTENVPYGTVLPSPAFSRNTESTTGSKVFTNKSNIVAQNNTGTVIGTLSQHFWDIQLNSTGTSTAPYVWMALEKGAGSGLITIDSVVLKPSNVVISPASIYNTSDRWYQISTAGLTPSSIQRARVYFKYTSCTLDSLLLKASFDCPAYPSPNPIAYLGSVSQTYLKVDPQPSQVQLSVLRQPGGGSSIDLCTVDSALIVVNSAQAANLVNPYVTFFPPAGLTLVTPIKVEYPRGSGDYQNATVTSLPGGGYQIDLSAHTGIGASGMFGTANANPAYVPLGGDREAKIKVDFTTDCSFTSGTSFTFNAYGNRPCGSPAIDNGIAATTSKLDITGASAPGGAGVVISFGGAATSVGCGSTAVTLSLITTPTTFGTTAGDTMTYTLPIGMGYAGNLTAGYSAVVTGGGGAPTIVKVAMPTGVAPSTPINFNFDVEPRGGGCGSVNITGAYQRRIASLLCGAVPCASSSVVISTATSPNITLVKPSLVISNIAILDTTAWRQANYAANHIRLFYTNNGTQALTANVDTVEFFCNSTATVPFAKRPLTKNIAIGASDSDEYYIMMPIGACTLGDVITAKIQTTTAGGTAQCLCAPSQYVAAGIGLPLAFLTTNAQVNDCAVNLSWSYNNSANVANFEIERSNNGANYSSIATLKAATENYVDVTPNSGKWFYRIKAKSLEGSLAYSQTITATTSQCVGNSVTIYPNPASEQLQIVLQGASSNNEYQMVDALGRVVLRGNLQANTNNKVDVSAVAQGVYVIKIISDGNVSTQQVQIRK